MFYINFKNNNLNNDGNKGKYRVKMCYFCNEEDQSNNKNRNNFKNSNITNLKGTIINKKVDFEETKLKINEQTGNTKLI